MKSHRILALGLSAAACTAGPQPAAVVAEPAERTSGGEWSNSHIRSDVEQSVEERFGGAAIRRALAADASVMVKIYRGLPLPPVRQPDGSWSSAPHPAALLLREDGQWLRADAAGVRPVRAVLVPELEGLLDHPDFWSEPARVPQGGCTDGGSSLAVIRLPGREATVRQGTCGGPPLHSRLVNLALAQ